MLNNKDYCDYDTCVALKKLGYKEKTLAYYTSEGIFYWRRAYIYDVAIPDLAKSSNKELYKHVLDAVSLYDAQKFLREEKKLIVLVGFDFCPITSEIAYNWAIVVNGNTAKKSSYTYDYFEEALSEGIKEAVKILKENETIHE